MSKNTTRFNPELLDLSKCVPSCDESEIHPELLDKLRSMQALCGFRFTINSGFRPKYWELKHGRNGSSSHSKCPGLAVDISTVDSHTRYKVVCSACAVGVPRIGIGKTFVHLDIDETKAHPIIFHYYD